jgi:hypothetical protein
VVPKRLRARKTSALLPLGHMDLIKHCLGKERSPHPSFLEFSFSTFVNMPRTINVSESINLSKIEG